MTTLINQTLLTKNREGTYPVQECVYAMANVFSDRNEEVSIQVNPDPLHVGLAYFKYYNASSYVSATKVARISMHAPLYVFHNNSDGKQNWILNSKERKVLHNALKKRIPRLGLTVWENTILYYDREKFPAISIEEILECTVENKQEWIEKYGDVSRFIDTIVPIDLPLPNYLLLK